MAERLDEHYEGEPVEGQPGWYPHPTLPNQERYWTGERWTDHSVRREGARPTAPVPTSSQERPDAVTVLVGGEVAKSVIFALSLGFGVAGAASLLGVPVLAFYFPLGLGAAGLALAGVGYTVKGDPPWYSWIAVGVSVAALIQGISAYNDYHKVQNQINQAQEQFQRALP
jgi:hypothetical protein